MTFVLATLVLLAAIVVVVVLTVRALIVICPPNKVAVVSGRSRGLSDGRSVGYRVHQGWTHAAYPDAGTGRLHGSQHDSHRSLGDNAYSKGRSPGRAGRGQHQGVQPGRCA